MKRILITCLLLTASVALAEETHKQKLNKKLERIKQMQAEGDQLQKQIDQQLETLRKQQAKTSAKTAMWKQGDELKRQIIAKARKQSGNFHVEITDAGKRADTCSASDGDLILNIRAPLRTRGSFLADRVFANAERITANFDMQRGVIVHLYKYYPDQKGEIQKANSQRCVGQCNGLHRIYISYYDEQYIFDNLPILLHHVYGVEIPQADRVD